MFDEIEKAHKDIFNVLLQILDDGRITDGQEMCIRDSNYIKELDGTLVEYTEKTFKYYVYNDYSNLNNQLIDRYNFPMKIFYEEIPYLSLIHI